MSVRRSGEDESIDYSDYKYQHFEVAYSDNGGNSAASAVATGVDPLETSGGLEINEVAELVAMRITVDISGDSFEAAADTAQGHLQMRGAIGANLNSRADELGSAQQVAELDQSNGIEDDVNVLFEQDNPDLDVQFRSHDKDEVFYHFQVGNDTPFSSDAGGVGGGGGATAFINETIAFRDLTGRGPVLDSSDELSVVASLNKNQVSVQAEGIIRCTLIWDISSVDDAGRRFSVPM